MRYPESKRDERKKQPREQTGERQRKRARERKSEREKSPSCAHEWRTLRPYSVGERRPAITRVLRAHRHKYIRGGSSGCTGNPLSVNVNFVNEKLILRSQWHKKVLQFGGRGEERVMQARVGELRCKLTRYSRSLMQFNPADDTFVFRMAREIRDS